MFWVGADDWIAVNEDLFADFLLLMVVLMSSIALVVVSSRDVVGDLMHFHHLVLIVVLLNYVSNSGRFEYLLLFVLRYPLLFDLVSILHLVLLLFFQSLLLDLDFSIIAGLFDRLLRTLLLVDFQDLLVEFLYVFSELFPVEGC